jgi:dienelactone hydrolase
MTLKKLKSETPLPLFYIGPDIEEGPLPAILYLALSAEETLLTDPYNQPVTFCSKFPVRVFSVDIPFHGPGLDPKKALEEWAHAFAQGEDVVTQFLIKLEETLSHLFTLDIVLDNNLAVMGLSRGGFLANHLAARIPNIKNIVSYAPLTLISKGKDFEFLSLCPILESLDLKHFIDPLCTKKQRIYIGNRDTRVNTDACYEWYRSLVEAAYNKQIRSPHIELIIKPSIGHHGHGTAKTSFEEGASWILDQILP